MDSSNLWLAYQRSKGRFCRHLKPGKKSNFDLFAKCKGLTWMSSGDEDEEIGCF